MTDKKEVMPRNSYLISKLCLFFNLLRLKVKFITPLFMKSSKNVTIFHELQNFFCKKQLYEIMKKIMEKLRNSDCIKFKIQETKTV